MKLENLKNVHRYALALIGGVLVFVVIFALLERKSHNDYPELFKQSLSQHKDLRLIPGFNDAMCETLEASGPPKTCEKLTGVLNNLAKEIVMVIPNHEKGFTFQLNCMTAVDQADGKKKCHEGVLMTLFDDNSMTIVHFRNTDLNYLTGLSKFVLLDHPMLADVYVGKGKHSKEANPVLPELAVEALTGFDRDYASGTHRDVLLQARRDSDAEIRQAPEPIVLVHTADK